MDEFLPPTGARRLRLYRRQHPMLWVGAALVLPVWVAFLTFPMSFAIGMANFDVPFAQPSFTESIFESVYRAGTFVGSPVILFACIVCAVADGRLARLWLALPAFAVVMFFSCNLLFLFAGSFLPDDWAQWVAATASLLVTVLLIRWLVREPPDSSFARPVEATAR